MPESCRKCKHCKRKWSAGRSFWVCESDEDCIHMPVTRKADEESIDWEGDYDDTF